ncbi:MAG: T9SS type A sorting domain-containing protein, partial [Candidatus Kapaibacteriota bacterium]
KTILEVPGETGELQLLQNKPNPFENTTRIEFYLPNPSNVRLTLSNLLGDFKIELFHGNLTQGLHSFEVSSEKLNLSSGVYVYTLDAGGKKISRQMILNK